MENNCKKTKRNRIVYADVFVGFERPTTKYYKTSGVVIVAREHNTMIIMYKTKKTKSIERSLLYIREIIPKHPVYNVIIHLILIHLLFTGGKFVIITILYR